MKTYLKHWLVTVFSGGLAAIIAAEIVHAQVAGDEGTKFLSLSAVLQRQNDLRKFVVPVEQSSSLPLPTFRCHGPGFASFASAAIGSPGQPMEQDVPNRWWVFDAKNGKLLLFAITQAMPFSDDKSWKPIAIESRFATVSEMQKAQQEIEGLVDELAPLFFAHQQAAAEKRAALLEALHRYVPPELMPQYQALVPDFFKWLGDKSAADRSANQQTQ
jgi:hypothetical protein